jgi:hypothetical protein
VRYWSAWALGQVAVGTREVCAGLAAALTDDDPGVRLRSLETLLRLHPQDDDSAAEVREAVRKLLGRGDEAVGRLARKLLGGLCDPGE